MTWILSRYTANSRTNFHSICLNLLRHNSLNTKNYYEILGVTEAATQEEIRNAFVKKTKQYHPDAIKNRDKDTSQNFIDVKEAYKVLSYSYSRRTYNEKNNLHFKSGSFVKQDYGGRRSPEYKNPYINARRGNTSTSWTHYYNENSSQTFHEATKNVPFWDEHWKKTGELGGYDSRNEEKKFKEATTYIRKHLPSFVAVNVVVALMWISGISALIYINFMQTDSDEN